MLQVKKYNRAALVVLDGFGVATPSRGNAISLAGTPVFDNLVRHYPSTTLQASGPLVGLPWGEMGNSEVGHLNLGAGRIVGQDLPRINNSIHNGSFFTNAAFLGAASHAVKNNSALHLMGLASKGGVHSSIDHLYALLAFANQQGVPRVIVHFFCDGRDTAERVALDDLKTLRAKIGSQDQVQIATVMGRFYAMDRGGHWQQTEQAFRAIADGEGVNYGLSAEELLETSYSRGIYDEMVEPGVVSLEGPAKPLARVQDNDAIIFYNFRSDRALQLTQAFVEPDQTPLKGRIRSINNLYFCTMTEYRQVLPVQVAFASEELSDNLSEYLAKLGLSQFHAAESEKYAHVTSFFNCGRNEPFPLEDRMIVKSPADNAKNYQDSPQMAAYELTSVVTEKIVSSGVNFILANYANGDMVGHTGNLNACLAAVRVLDDCIGKVAQAALQADVPLFITADHGNIEQTLNPRTGSIDKDHTTNPVPLIIVCNELKDKVRPRPTYHNLSSVVPQGVISDVAPTILALLGLEKPAAMTGINLLEVL